MLNPIQRYLGHLQSFLIGKVSLETVNSISNETENHLRDIADEIKQGGLDLVQSEEAAVQRYGPASSLALAILHGDIDNMERAWATWLKFIGWGLICFAFLVSSQLSKADVPGFAPIIIIPFTLFLAGCWFAKRSHFLWLALLTIPCAFAASYIVFQGPTSSMVTEIPVQAFPSQTGVAFAVQYLERAEAQNDLPKLIEPYIQPSWQLPIPPSHVSNVPINGAQPGLVGYSKASKPIKGAGSIEPKTEAAPPTVQQFKDYMKQASKVPYSKAWFPLGKQMPVSQARALWLERMPDFALAVQPFLPANQLVSRPLLGNTALRDPGWAFRNAFQLMIMAAPFLLLSLLGPWLRRKIERKTIRRQMV